MQWHLFACRIRAEVSVAHTHKILHILAAALLSLFMSICVLTCQVSCKTLGPASSLHIPADSTLFDFSLSWHTSFLLLEMLFSALTTCLTPAYLEPVSFQKLSLLFWRFPWLLPRSLAPLYWVHIAISVPVSILADICVRPSPIPDSASASSILSDQ